jgi:DNA topoisomerase-3
VKDTGSAIITKIAIKRKVEKAPLLYDLTTLQKEANSQHGFTAEHTLSIAQKLYEAKFITYPRTSSRYISDDVFATLPKLFKNLENHSEYGEKVKLLPGSEDYSKNSVNTAKVTDHHALLITENAAIGLFKDEKIVYDMILCRMIEAFSTDCIKDITLVSAQVDHEIEFGISGSIIRQTGWRALSLKEKNNKKDKNADATDNEVKEQVIPNWQEGQHITLSGCTITEGKTKPKPLHTESTLLAVMETAGKEIEDDTMRQAMKDSGIGTPATRAAIIETLLKREYMVRQQKKLVPTEKGLALHSVVKNMAIANVEMTGKWEAELAKIERGEASADGFTHSIEGYTREITAELLGCDRLFIHKDSGSQCPKCKQGTMQFFGKVVRCSNKECGMPVFKQVAGKLLTDADITDLLTKGKTRTLNGFTSKQGKSFSAAIAFDENFNTKFVFAERKTAEKRGNVKRYKK